MNSKHTATPWRINPRSRSTVQTLDGDTVAACGVRSDLSKPNLHEELEANAALIVRAVNCHEELVAALEKAANQFGCLGYVDSEKYYRAILAKVQS